MFRVNSTFFLMLLGWIFVPYYLNSQVFTMPEFLEKRYDKYDASLPYHQSEKKRRRRRRRTKERREAKRCLGIVTVGEQRAESREQRDRERQRETERDRERQRETEREQRAERQREQREQRERAEKDRKTERGA